MPAEVETFAYNSIEAPWHGLGVPVNGDLTPVQMLKEAKLNWKVEKVPAYISLNKKKLYIGQDALVRSTDNKILDVVSQEWNTVQNLEAASFFDEFVKEGEMSMETAGSLSGGQIMFMLAKINQSFDLFKGNDLIESYMLFTNPHRYGWSTSVSYTAIRVVCMNTLMLSLGKSAGTDKIVKISHRKEFIAEQVKEALNISRAKLAKYKEMATFLASKKAEKSDVVQYFKEIFPVLSVKSEPRKDISKSASKCLDLLDTQPGAELGEGTWWAPYNAVTRYADHEAGRTLDTRLSSAWYGENRKRKVKALQKAVEYADA